MTTIRAFEVYPRVMYGLDSIPGWNRLLAVIPIEYRGLIDDAKSQVDFWANSWILSLLFMGEYLAVSLQQANFQLLWLPVLMVIIYILSYARAKSAAAEWGDFVKAAFDIYLPELQRKLGFPNQNSISEERQLWSRFSRAIIYVNSEHMPQRDDKTEDQKSASKASRVA